MSGKFQAINRDTAYLLPPSLQDWLPEKHLARFVVDIVDQLDLSELVTRYGGGGKQPYHPAVLSPEIRTLTMTRSPLFASGFCLNWKVCLYRY